MRINHQIKSEKLIVIDETGKSLGVLSRGEALKIAVDKGLDLLEVNPTANPPVAKILDYGKFEYHQRKAERKIKTTHKNQELKIMRIGLKTSAHDAGVKAGQADKFLQKGHKVKMEIFLRGREKAHRDLARQKLVEFEKLIEETHKQDGNMVSTPSGWSLMIHK